MGMSAEEFKVWLAVRTDLGMSPGKMAVQAAHAAVGLMLDVERKYAGLMTAYENSAMPKIAVRAKTQADLNAVEVEARAFGIPYYVVRDAGRSEIEPGTKTVVAFGPALRSQHPSGLKRLQLLTV